QSQRDPAPKLVGAVSGPMVYIANNWSASSPTTVRVYSNCDEVTLYANDSLVGTQKADDDRISTNLAHPPFTFKLDRFQPGSLRRVVKSEGEEVSSQLRSTA